MTGRTAGGPGMVLKPEPMLAAIEAARARLPQGSREFICRRRVSPSDSGRPSNCRRRLHVECARVDERSWSGVSLERRSAMTRSCRHRDGWW